MLLPLVPYGLHSINHSTAPSSATTPLGINCRGSFFCSSKPIIPTLKPLISLYIPPFREYVSEQYIACVENWHGNYCAFFQYAERPITGSEVLKLLDLLYAHGCGMCGSVPVGYPYNNDPRVDGILIVNYVVDTKGCRGVC